MADATNELISELIKRFHERFDKLDHGLSQVKQERIALPGHMLSTQNDIHTIDMKLDRVDERFDRVERRLDW
ncbi:hypothetical protein LQ948_08070 [Jiella sp. MQZ9-1]|uniref:t-SNARE coiled-coil homology domain-containing protein n=1 Tax=Jiella flava TaxID=2816857 RepID=A0A939FWD6_9HYPH|nr:hypothetical protein [Jiella flava]MBO0662742.1 hypothetical protein [Jiella flava]MCD2471164.1 hypothetical protein [Jiella flava]